MSVWYCFPNRTLAEQIGITNDMRDRGFTPVSLSLHAERSGAVTLPRYSTVWHQRPGPPVDNGFLALAETSEIKPWLDEQKRDGRYPRLIDGYGADPRERRFSILATPGPATEIDEQALVGIAMGTIRSLRYDRGWFPAWASLFGDNTGAAHDTRIAFVWEKQPADRFYYWNLLLEDEPDYTEASDARRAAFAWPHLLSITNGAGGRPRQRLSVWRDDEIENLHQYTSVPVAKLDATVKAIATAGDWLLSLQGTDYGPGQVFDLVIARAGHWLEKPRKLTRRYAGRSTKLPKDRAHRTSGVSADVSRPVRVGRSESGGSLPIGRAVRVGTMESDVTDDAVLLAGGPFREVDDYVIDLMKRRSIRAGQLAIARDGRLVHAAAFTWADDVYPIATPVTRIRLGSVAKVATAIALVKLAETPGTAFDLFDVTNQNIGELLGIHHTGWDQRSAAHLLTHTAHFRSDLGVTWDSLTIANALGRSRLGITRKEGLESDVAGADLLRQLRSRKEGATK